MVMTGEINGKIRIMQITSISSTGSWYSSQTTKLTDKEKSTLQEILSQYDPENLSEEDVQSLMEDLKNSGIKPSNEVKQLIAEAGFEIPEPPKSMDGEMDGTDPMSILFDDEDTESGTSELVSALEQYRNGEISEEELRAKVSEITASVLYGFNSSITGSLVNVEA